MLPSRFARQVSHQNPRAQWIPKLHANSPRQLTSKIKILTATQQYRLYRYLCIDTQLTCSTAQSLKQANQWSYHYNKSDQQETSAMIKPIPALISA